MRRNSMVVWMVIASVLFEVGVVGCHRGNCEMPQHVLEQLLIDESAYPSGWVKGRSAHGEASAEYFETSRENIVNPFSAAPGVTSIQFIWRYCTMAEAGRQYAARVQGYEARGSNLSYRSRVSFVSSKAQEFIVFCGRFADSSRELCNAVGLYGLYVMEVSGHIDGKHMTYADFDRVLAAADGKMAQVLVNSPAATPTPGP